MADFEVTTDTDSITITWTLDDVKSVAANFIIKLDDKEKYRGDNAPTSPYTLTGLMAGTTYTVILEFTTTRNGESNTPVGAWYTTSR